MNEAFLLFSGVLIFFILYFLLARGQRKSLILKNGKKTAVDAEIADNMLLRAKGMMGRSSLGENQGMLFIFPRPGKYGFWMLGTAIPLEAICFSEEKTVVDILKLEPHSLSVCYPKKPAKYVLEVKNGFSRNNNVKIGRTRIENA